MNNINIDYDKIKLELICRKYMIKEVSLFGSALRDDFNQKSDVDLIIEFMPEARITLLKFQQLRDEFEKLFKRSVDLVSKKELISSTNKLRKHGILNNTLLIYGS